MEITGVNSKAYTSAAAAFEEDEELQEQQEETKEQNVSTVKKDEKDRAEFSSSAYDEADVEEKAENYLKNLLFVGGLTDASTAALQNYLNTFDVAKFIKDYGPFTSTSEISAAMYAAVGSLIKQQQDE